MGNVFGNIVNTVKKAVTDTGHAVGNAVTSTPGKLLLGTALAATGFGAPAAAGIMGATGLAGGAIKSGGGLKGSLIEGAKGAAGGALAGKAGDLLYGGLGAVGSGSGLAAQGGGLLSSAAGLAKSSVADRVKSLLTGGGGGGGGADGGGSSLLDKLLLGGTVAAGAADEMDKRNLRNKAVDAATGSYDSRAPLRARAMSLLAKDQPRDLSSLFADPGNVYDVKRRAASLLAPSAPAA